MLDTSSVLTLARSVLSLHKTVSCERQRAVWLWEEQGALRSDVDVYEPVKDDLEVGRAWRNDYYLHPLWSITQKLLKPET